MGQPILYGSYNIINGQNRELYSLLRGMSQENFNLETFQGKKFMGGIYVTDLSGYRVTATEASSRHIGSIVVFYRKVEKFTFELICLQGQNISILRLKT